MFIVLFSVLIFHLEVTIKPPPPPLQYKEVHNYASSLPRDTPYLGKTDGPFYGLFHIISTPFLGNFSHLTTYLGNIMVTPIPFLVLFFLFSFGLGKHVYLFYHYPRGGGACPLFSEVYSTLGKHVPQVDKKYPKSREICLKYTLFKLFSEKSSKDKRPKYPLCRENGNTHAPLRDRGGGGEAAIKSSLYICGLDLVDLLL